MKFFVPLAADQAMAEEVYASVRAHLLRMGYPTTERRIQRIAFNHNGQAYDLAIGSVHPDLNEEVFVLLEASDGNLFYACTPSRGVVRDDPYWIGGAAVTAIIDFEG